MVLPAVNMSGFPSPIIGGGTDAAMLRSVSIYIVTNTL